MAKKKEEIVEKKGDPPWIMISLWLVSLVIFGISFVDGNPISTRIMGIVVVLFSLATIYKILNK